MVLFKARSGEEAISKGVKEAKEYARSIRYTNILGQRARTLFLNFALGYELSDPPDAGVEVFSATEVVDADKSDSQITKRLIDHEDSDRWPVALQFIRADIGRHLIEELVVAEEKRGPR